MVANGSTEATIIKAKFLGDIRKTSIRHNHDVTFNDLVLMLQRIFTIKPSLPVVLKYRDSGIFSAVYFCIIYVYWFVADGDFISLNDDNDVTLALQTETSLFLEVSVSSRNKMFTFRFDPIRPLLI